MTLPLRIKACFIAEGITPDSRGLISAIAIEPATWQVDSFPAQIVPTFVLIAEDTAEHPLPIGTEFAIEMGATAPDGTVLFMNRQSGVLAEKRKPDMPNRLQIAFQVPLRVSGPGSYIVSAKIAFGTESETLERPVNVRQLTAPAAS